MKKFLRKIVSQQLLNFYHLIRAVFANIIYGFPTRTMRVIGVTGTDGKTTTVHFITHILEHANLNPGMLSTIAFRIGDKYMVNETKMTTVSEMDLQKKLASMRKHGNRIAVIETSSHSLVQNRVWGISYDVAVMTNLSSEHLDFHKTMEEYQKAKKKLCNLISQQKRKPGQEKILVLNRDDATFVDYSTCRADRIIGYGMEEGDVYAKEVLYNPEGMSFILVIKDIEYAIQTKVQGEWNVYNMVAAASASYAVGVDAEIICEALRTTKGLKGRFEEIHAHKDQNFSVFIDYAVTAKAFETIYSAITKIPHNKLISVFGACGDRDTSKRPILGQIAAKYADYIVLTNEDNWSERAEDIVSAIEKGIIDEGKHKGVDYHIELDRKLAIEQAIFKAQEGDIVLITGKGAETAMALSVDKRIAWSEHEVITQAIHKKLG